jgi:PIN domain nuclease of toxin-antitoxin system
MGRGPVIILDTHAWIWWLADPDRLSAKARAAIGHADRLAICAISCWELGMLVAKGRLELDRDVGLWIQQALAQPRCALLPLTPEIAVKSAGLEDGPGDPADRMILASALIERAPVVSRDRHLRRFAEVRTIW